MAVHPQRLTANAASKARRRRLPLLLRVGFLLLAFLLADQLVHRAVLGRTGRFLGRRFAPYEPPLFAPHQFDLREQLRAAVDEQQRGAKPSEASARLLASHDPELGWIANSVSRPAERFGMHGGRLEIPEDEQHARDSSFSSPRDPGVRRIVAVGCSFTFGEEVPAADVWVSRIDRARQDLEACNLGVSAYGVDQALLRLRRDGLKLEPDEVWLGLVPSTLPRIESHDRLAYRHWANTIWFKPRFVVGGDGELELVPNPGTTPARTLELLTDQHAFFEAVGATDRWVASSRAAYMPYGAHPLHHSGIARILLTMSEVRGRHPPHAVFDRPGDSSLELLGKLLARMNADVRAAGATLRIVVLGGQSDVGYWARRGGGPSGVEPLRSLTSAGVPVHDMIEPLVEARAHEDSSFWMPGGHYTPGANALIAEWLAAEV